MKKVVILQARISSSRLPRRVLLELAGRPIIHHILDRLETSKEADEICVAIPEVATDDELANSLEKRNVRIVRGPEYDVLTRFTIAAYDTHADIVIRATADNPLVDVGVMDAQIRHITENPDTDYVFTKGLPLGVSTETFTRKTLDKLEYLARTPFMREHVTYYLVQNPAPFSVVNLDPPAGMGHPELRLTLDTREDYALFQAIYGEFYAPGTVVNTKEVVSFLLDRPELVKINSKVIQVPNPHALA